MQRISVQVAAACVAAAVFGSSAARAEIVVSVNKSTQTMLVLVNGAEKHRWIVSTGLGGGPPTGTYRPQRFERRWFSRKYHNAPMPYAIFFHEGYALHGTTHISQLGRRASKGCVRLHPRDAAVLFDLVRASAGATRIVIGNAHVAPRPAPVAETPNADTVKPAALTIESAPATTGAIRVEAAAEPTPAAPVAAQPESHE